MDPRRRKQLIYGGFFIVIVCLIALGIFLRERPVASCFDGVQDGGETGVDCGGPCAKICTPTNLQSINLQGNVQVFASSPGHYTFLAEVANTSMDFGAQNFDFSFDLYGGASDTLIESIPGQSFIYPGEVKYILAPNISVNPAFLNASLTIADTLWAPSGTIGAVPDLTVQSLGPGPASSSTISINGEVTDNDASSFNQVLIVAVFKDANGNPVGASETELDGIAPNQTETFTVSYPAAPNIALSLTELYAYALRQ